MINRIDSDDEVCVLLLVKGKHRYSFTYDDSEAGRTYALRKFGEYATRADLPFSWYDAAKLSSQVREPTP